MARRVLSIVGARPQFVKLAVICRAAQKTGSAIEHRIVHTGQHYDAAMNDVFFQELEIPAPDFNLEIGSGRHGAQTGAMLHRIEDVLLEQRPDWVLVYGDTNSTLAGALAAAKLHIPIAHVEAGLRSFNRLMPEEINRVVADHLSQLLFCPTHAAIANLKTEGLDGRAVWTGDVMYDAVLHGRQVAERQELPPELARYTPGSYALATVHRAENTDDAARLQAITSALDRISAELCPVLLPVHPRTRKMLDAARWRPRHLCLLEPLSYFQMLRMESGARMILTDSGGVQKEAYFMRIPCITLRDETEWTETLENGCNTLAGASEENILKAAGQASAAGPWEAHYGHGNAGQATIQHLTA